VLRQQIDPARLMRSIDELAGWLFEAASFPEGVVLLTGGGAAVPPGFALVDGDEVRISHPELGDLENRVSNRVSACTHSDGPMIHCLGACKHEL
jgi:fumarylacetoacetate (FAA) hydrolase family protein